MRLDPGGAWIGTAVIGIDVSSVRRTAHSSAYRPAEPANWEEPGARPAHPLKVCVTGLRGIPNVMGGVETHCEELYPRLQKLRPDIAFELISRAPYTGRCAYSYEGVQVTPLRAVKSKHLEAISNTFLAVLHARFRAHADILHIHAIGPGLLAPLARLLGLRIIVTHHGRDYQRAKWKGIGSAVLAAGEWCAFAAADRVLVVSKWLAEDLARQYPRHAHKIAFTPNGAPAFEPRWAGAAPDDILARLGVEPGGYILAVGRLVPEKGFHDLLDAFEGMQGVPKLVVAGSTDHTDSYARKLLSRAGDRVVFAGRVDRGRLDALYRNADRFVLPSYHEGLPIAALEAAACGAAVVLSDIPANLDLDLPARHYFPVGDVGALRRKLQEPAASLRADADEVARRFDWDVIAAETANAYR
jgi:glycosyltransferase involved in cell wall biosynthesis